MITTDASGTVRVFFAKPNPAQSALAILSADELERADRFHFDDDRNRFIAGRTVVRRSLSRFADVEPADWRFTTNDYGRPEVAGPADGERLKFSASRTKELVMCAVTVGRGIGADVERVRDHPTDVVDRYFSPKEAAVVRQSQMAKKASAFFAIWTLKEAYCKAKGVGLSLPLEKISFTLQGSEPVLEIDPPLEDDTADWHFRLIEPAPGYVVALCVAARPQLEMDVEIEWVG